MRDHYGHEKDNKPSTKPNDKFIGPQVMLYDNWRTAGWDLLTHGGFATYPHHDAAGFCTFLYVRNGAKLWVFLSLKCENTTGIRAKLFDDYDAFLDDEEPYFNDEVVLGSLLLEENDFL
jgi:hypothetical protein